MHNSYLHFNCPIGYGVLAYADPLPQIILLRSEADTLDIRSTRQWDRAVTVSFVRFRRLVEKRKSCADLLDAVSNRYIDDRVM